MRDFIFDWIKSFYGLSKEVGLEVLMTHPDFLSHKYFWGLGLFAGVAVLFAIIWFLTRQVLVGIVNSFAAKTKTELDDILVQNRFFSSLAHLVPLLFLDYLFGIAFFAFPQLLDFSIRVNEVLIVLVVLISLRRFLNGVGDVLSKKPSLEGKPINSYIQTVKIIVTIIFVILMLSVLTKQSPVYFLTSLGAMTAILLLVFKDTILGFVGSIQLSANDMVRIGDWVTMEKYGADGDVMEINLTTVKVQNFDKTITTIPTYSFISDSFKNWRGMEESDGRRIKRSVAVQLQSVKFADKVLIEKLSKVKLLSEFIEKRQEEIKQYNDENGLDESQLNARKQTNLGLFRRYLEYYLSNHEGINTEMTLMVRQLPPSPTGVPIELYCFTRTKEWMKYEVVMADIFDHIFAVVTEFELTLFENPAGKDIRDALKKL
jgi:miniconductance mechanosensitive channel